MTNFRNYDGSFKCYFTDFDIYDVLLMDGFFVGGEEIRCGYVVREYPGAYLLNCGEHFFFLDKRDLRSGKVAASVCGRIDRDEEGEWPPRLAA